MEMSVGIVFCTVVRRSGVWMRAFCRMLEVTGRCRVAEACCEGAWVVASSMVVTTEVVYSTVVVIGSSVVSVVVDVGVCSSVLAVSVGVVDVVSVAVAVVVESIRDPAAEGVVEVGVSERSVVVVDDVFLLSTNECVVGALVVVVAVNVSVMVVASMSR